MPLTFFPSLLLMLQQVQRGVELLGNLDVNSGIVCPCWPLMAACSRQYLDSGKTKDFTLLYEDLK